MKSMRKGVNKRVMSIRRSRRRNGNSFGQVTKNIAVFKP